MKRNAFACFAVWISAAVPGWSDTKITASYNENGQEVATTLYGDGQRLRYDYGKGLILLRQCDQKRLIQLDDTAKTYLSLPAEGPATPSEVKVTDTGERKQMFGYQARHLKAIQTANSGKDRTETDGWYADLKELGSCAGQDASAADRGYPLAYTITSYGENNKPSSKVTMTVTSVVNAPLSTALFEIPTGYADSAERSERSAQPKANGAARVCVVAMRGKPDSQTQANNAYGHLLAQLQEAKLDVVPLQDGPADTIHQKAAAWQCDYLLNSELAGVEKVQTGKVGGLLHHAPGISRVTGGDTYEARINYSLLPVNGGAPLLASAGTGKAGGQFNWKAAASMASNLVPMAMAYKMMSGGGMLNASMLNALSSGRGYGSSMTGMDPMMGGMSMFLRAANPAMTAASGPQTSMSGDAAIASALEQETRAIIAKLKSSAK
jgi:hypothetical protein